MRTIAIMNNKGGVGKTITAISLADILTREYHQRVVVCDCDGQMNLTRFYLPEFDPETNYTLASVLMGEGEAVWVDNLVPITPELHLLPASTDLYDLDRQAIQQGISAPERMVQFVDAARQDGETDFFLFDCPPGYTLASVGALLASDEVVVPMLVDGFSFAGMQALTAQINSLHRARHGLKMAGVLVTQWHNSEVVRQGEALLRSMRGVPVFEQTIRRTNKVPESTFERSPVPQYSPRSAASQDYRRWVRAYLGEALEHGV